ncbi:MAG: hypothetical protein ACIAXF_05700 [Phycisphaerales bacterium JB063]
MLAAIPIVVVACIVIWKGCEGFRERGLRVGIFQDHSQPLPKLIGVFVGTLLVLFGLAILAFGIFIAPRMFPEL